MEFVRRLRFLSACISLLAAGACTLAFFFGAAPSALFFALAVLFVGLSPYVQTSLPRMLSIMWLGAGASIAVAGGWMGGGPLIAQALTIVFGLWLFGFIGSWLVSALR